MIWLLDLLFDKKAGDIVENGDVLGYIHGNDEEKVKYVLNLLFKLYRLMCIDLREELSDIAKMLW